MQVEINGIVYVEREQKKSTHTPMLSYLGIDLFAMMGMYNSLSNNGSSLKASPPKVNIIEEFKLIQDKKSNLSRSQREYVVNKFNRTFKQLNENKI